MTTDRQAVPESTAAELWRDAKFRRLVATIAVVGIFEFLSLAGHHLPPVFGGLLFGAIILATGWRTLRKGLAALVRLNFASINLLMVVAAAGAFYLGQFEEAAVVIVLFTLGERLEDFGIETSRSALEQLVARAPKMADVKGKGEVPITDITVGDVVIVKPSGQLPMDGEVVAGSSSVDESTITGEPLPRDKHAGDRVFAGTLNKQGMLEVRVTRAANDSTLAKIVATTFDAARNRSETQRFIERFSSYYTPAILVVAVALATVPTLLLQKPFEPWLREALSLLVIACPCALVISTPISVYSAIGRASRSGVLVKGGRAIEAIGRVAVVAMDKTRTLTEGKPVIVEVAPFGTISREHLLSCAAGIELYSEHPLAQAVTEHASAEGLSPHAVTNFRAEPGKGARADCLVCFDRGHLVGKLAFIQEGHAVDKTVTRLVDEFHARGLTSIVVSNGREVEGVLAVSDSIKAESRPAIAELNHLGVPSVMLTGDHAAPAKAVAAELGILDVRAELLPDQKADAVRALASQYGPVAMVGDGVNDAPALALSSVGVAMGAAGSDTAIEAASIAILNDRIALVPFLVELGRATDTTIRSNTRLALATKLAFVALAVAGRSNLALAIFADVGITVIVILRSLRLLRFEATG